MTGDEKGAAGGVTFELYGVARLHAGIERVRVTAATLGEALAELERAWPPLAGTVVENGALSPHFRLSHNGRRFTSDVRLPLNPGDVLIVLSAAAGG